MTNSLELQILKTVATIARYLRHSALSENINKV
jgi:hypothetical protein